MPPEYILEGTLSTMYDVYSFGVTLLETISNMCKTEPARHHASVPWVSYNLHARTHSMTNQLPLFLVNFLPMQMDGMDLQPNLVPRICLTNGILLFFLKKRKTERGGDWWALCFFFFPSPCFTFTCMFSLYWFIFIHYVVFLTKRRRNKCWIEFFQRSHIDFANDSKVSGYLIIQFRSENK